VIPFLFVASEQLGALGALYEREEVLVPSGACMRSALEHSAHVLWVLQRADTEPFEQRLARALLEMLRSVEERKIVVCNLFGDDSPECAQWKERFTAEKQRIKDSFPDGLTYDRHLPVLLEQKVPGPEGAVAWMFDFLIDTLTTEDFLPISPIRPSMRSWNCGASDLARRSSRVTSSTSSWASTMLCLP
jgi:hypothetical protein